MNRLYKATAAISIIFLFSLVLLTLASADWIMFRSDPSHSGAGTGKAAYLHVEPTLSKPLFTLFTSLSALELN
jgi:hypothetical protein